MKRALSLCVLALAACSASAVPNLDSPDPYERYLGALEAADEGDAEAMKRVEAQLKDKDPLARTGAVVALARRKPPHALHLLVGMLNDADASVRTEAVRVVAEFRDPGTIPAIATILDKDPALETRRVAALALGSFPDSPALRAILLDAFSDPAAGVAYNAHSSLVRITGRSDLPRGRAEAEEALKKS
jgi:HEAT repeat protein